MQATGNEGASQKVRTTPAYEVVVDQLRRAIHLGTYAPGDKFPPERAHAEQLGVSRVTLREAVRVLEGEGYIETRRGARGGATVLERPRDLAALRRELSAGRDELEGILDFRFANECCAVERAATRMTPTVLLELKATIGEIASADSVGALRSADSTFHLTIADAADCALLRQAVEDGRAAMFDPLDALDFDLMIPRVVKDHTRIAKALEAGDAKRARQAMADHLTNTRQEIDGALDGAPLPA